MQSQIALALMDEDDMDEATLASIFRELGDLSRGQREMASALEERDELASEHRHKLASTLQGLEGRVVRIETALFAFRISKKTAIAIVFGLGSVVAWVSGVWQNLGSLMHHAK